MITGLRYAIGDNVYEIKIGDKIENGIVESISYTVGEDADVMLDDGRYFIITMPIIIYGKDDDYKFFKEGAK